MGGAVDAARGLPPPRSEGGGLPLTGKSWFGRSPCNACLVACEVGCAGDSCNKGCTVMVILEILDKSHPGFDGLANGLVGRCVPSAGDSSASGVKSR